ncbi:MAG: SocA family protein [Betaproteobacteria bacterium]|nr:SocA family protein [Betaproteobacteria bacterium]
MPYQPTFDAEKSLAATAYLAKQSGETMYTLLKMIYLVDRLHLERYGRPVSGDKFIAMKEGATPSRIYDSMKFLRGDKRTRNWLPDANKFLAVNSKTHDVSVIKMPALDVLSATDIECLDAILEILRQEKRWYVHELAHDAAWKKTTRNSTMDFMTIAESLGAAVAQHLADRFPGNA